MIEKMHYGLQFEKYDEVKRWAVIASLKVRWAQKMMNWESNGNLKKTWVRRARR